MPLLGPKQTGADLAQIVFIFFTILYKPKTLLIPSRIEHKSPFYGTFRKAFP
jgi:hypothetical protein